MLQLIQHLNRTDLNEMGFRNIPILQDLRCVLTAGFFQMACNQTMQLVFPMGHGDRAGHHGLRIEHIGNARVRIIKIGHPAGHACAEIGANPPEDHGDAPGHVFAPVRAAALHNDLRTRIPDREPLARTASRKQVAVCRTVQHRVADDHILRSPQRRMHWGAHDNDTARQAFADIVIGVPKHFQLQARRSKRPKGLARRPRELHGQMIWLQAVAHPKPADDVARRARANRAQRVLHRVG